MLSVAERDIEAVAGYVDSAMPPDPLPLVAEKSCHVCGRRFGADLERCPDDGSLLAAPDPLIGKIFDGRYEIEQFVGQGGMSLIYRARHLELGRTVALKFLKNSALDSPASVKRFKQEGKALALLHHAHINTVYHLGVSADGKPYLELEFLDGQTLNNLTPDSSSDLTERKVRLLSQVLGAVAYAHRQGIVHRDLKPGNIIVVQDPVAGEVAKVIDFGLSKFIGKTAPDSQRLTAPGAAVGTILYMSPEQQRGLDVDERSDIYALGIIMSESFQHNGTVPEPWQQIVSKSLAPEPQDRWPSVEALKAEFDKAFGALSRPRKAQSDRKSTMDRWPAGFGFYQVIVGFLIFCICAGMLWAGQTRANLPPQLRLRWAELVGADPVSVVRTVQDLASVEIAKHNYDKAARLYEEYALTLLPKLDAERQSDVLYQLGTVYCRAQDLVNANRIGSKLTELLDQCQKNSPSYDSMRTKLVKLNMDILLSGTLTGDKCQEAPYLADAAIALHLHELAREFLANIWAQRSSWERAHCQYNGHPLELAILSRYVAANRLTGNHQEALRSANAGIQIGRSHHWENDPVFTELTEFRAAELTESTQLPK